MRVLPSSKGRKFLFPIFLCFLFTALMGCGKEAKKDRHWGRGENYFAENKFKEAIIEYKSVPQIDPADVNARYKLGLAHLTAGQIREAYAEFSKSIELDQNPTLYFLLEDFLQAEKTFKKPGRLVQKSIQPKYGAGKGSRYTMRYALCARPFPA